MSQQLQTRPDLSPDAFLSLLNGMEVQLLVTEPVSGRILFANSLMNDSYNIREDPVGRECWTVYQKGMKERCPFCPVPGLLKNPAAPVRWEAYNELSGKWFRNTDSIIPWTNGRLVHLQQAVDITGERKIKQTLEQRLEQQKLMSAISRNFIAADSVATMTDQALGLVGGFLGLDRVVLARARSDTGELFFDHGWYKNEACRHRAVIDPTPALALFEHYFLVKKKNAVTCRSVTDSDKFLCLSSYGVNAFLAVPLFVENDLWGVLSLEMCTTCRNWEESDIALAGMVGGVICGVLAKIRIQERVAEAQKRAQEELVRARDKAEESARAKTNFLANMSHEIRTPLNAIVGMAEIARSCGNLGKMHYCLDKIDDAAAHLLGVINDILDMSKIEAGKLEIFLADFPLEEMLRRVKDIAGFRAEQKNQDFIVTLADDVPRAIVADRQRLAQVITNLLANAVKFTPEKGKISLDISKVFDQGERCGLLFEVRDTGIGISKEQQARLWQSFEQVDGAISRRFGGAGLGLPISRSFIEAMGGEVGVDSEPGRGSRFYFTITVGKGQCGMEERPDFGNCDCRIGIFEGKRALLAEDVDINREILESLLEETGLCLDQAKNGRAACEAFARSPDRYDLILMDIHMPEMDGYQATRTIRSMPFPEALAIPIVAMTANVFKEDIEHCLAAGMNDHLGKPVNRDEAIEKLRRFLTPDGRR